MENITIEDLSNPDNLGECECGNWTHHDYLTHNGEEGTSTCPACQIDYMGEIIKKLTELTKEIADPELSRHEVNNMIKLAYGKIYGIDNLEDLDFLNLN